MNNFLDAEIVLFKNKATTVGLKQGHPSFFLVARRSTTLFEEATLFLAEEFVENGGTPSIHTWGAAADGLKSWFEFLQAMGRDWRDATRQDRLNYRDAYLTSISPRTGQRYEPSTVASRMCVVGQFYDYAHDSGWYDGDLAFRKPNGEMEINVPINQDALAHIRRKGLLTRRDKDLPKARANVVIHALPVDALRSLLNFCGPRAAQRNGDGRPARDRLFVDLGWVVGLRVEEIHSLTTLQFLNLHPDSKAPQVAHPLIVTGKGSKTRQAAIPGWLLEDAIAYINGERAEALRVGKVSSKAASRALFLGGTESSRAGRPISKRRLQQIVEEACLAIGLTDVVEVIDPETGKRCQKCMQRYSIHDLRHTAAVLIYHAERAAGNPEPWKKVQTQLGHKNLQTTIDTYLHHVEIFGEKQRFYDVRKMIGI
jgi:integrase